MSVSFCLAFEMARLPRGSDSLEWELVFSFLVVPKAEFALYYLLSFFVFFLVNDLGVQPSLYDSLLLVLAWGGNPDLIKKWPWGETRNEHFKMSVQQLRSINKLDKNLSAMVICSNRADPCPHWVTCGSSSFTSTTSATDPSFQLYDRASATLSPEKHEGMSRKWPEEISAVICTPLLLITFPDQTNKISFT